MNDLVKENPMTGHDDVRLETTGAVATVTLNRPQVYNAMDTHMRSALAEAIRTVDADPAVRIVILRGEGPGFCAGADLGEDVSDSAADQLETEYKPILMAIAASPKIWMAAIHGSAAGIGCALALNCDLLVMAEDANIYLAFAAIGLVPDGGANWLLLQAMGYARALETVIEGRRVPAGECVAIGLANRLAPPGLAFEWALEWANSLARGAPLAQAAAKRILRRVGGVDYGTAITMEAGEQQVLSASEDFRAGVAAFFAREKPEFRGR
jgi:2-(1,2-epoxy-1,2-dihydrophenyl)acetyl-CoA isomerase